MSEPPATPPATSSNAPAPPPAPLAPADLLPVPSRRERLAWYSGAVLASVVLLTVGMQLWKRDLRAPFYYDQDGLLYLPLVRAVVEQGFWNGWHTERLGALAGQELYDFPVIDFLHFAVLWALAKAAPDLALVYNLYSLAGYPLAVLTCMWVFRWLKLSLPAAAVGALLYAFLPYHQERFQYHYFLALYWWVPVSMVPALAILQGDMPFFRRGPDGEYPPIAVHWRAVWRTVGDAARGHKAAWGAALRWLGRATRGVLRGLFTLRSLALIALGVVTASAGAYYAFFACACYAFAGAYGWVIHRTWRAAASAALLVVPVVTVGVLYHVPAALYQVRYQANPITDRYPYDADNYGLKIAHLLLPANDHNLRPLANVRKAWGTSDRPSENETAGSFGLVGGTGLVALIVLTFLPRKRQWPEGTLSAFAMFLVLLTTIGAFGALFNQLVTPQIRAYNRASVFLALPCLFVVMWWLDRFLATRTGRRARRARLPVLALVLLFGYFDQTPWGWNPFNPRAHEKTDLQAKRFRSDQQFFQQVEAKMAPGGGRVFCLPHASFPENPPIYKMAVYEHARGFLHTDTLYWSYGSIKNREDDVWAREVAAERPENMLPRLIARGFDGLLIDGRGFIPKSGGDVALVNRVNELYRQLAGVPRTARLPEVVHEDGRQFFLDLRPYREAYQRTDPKGYELRVKAEAEWVAALWLGGFLVVHSPEDNDHLRWGRFDSDLVFVNPTDRARWFDISFVIGAEVVGPFDITVGHPGGPLYDRFELNRTTDPNDTRHHGEKKAYPRVKLEPGRTVIHFRARPPSYFLPFDRRNLCYFIKDFQMRERERPEP